MATIKYDPAEIEARLNGIRRHLEYAVVAVVREALPSPLEITDYASAMVACDEAEDREVEAGVLMELLVACQEAAEFVVGCRADRLRSRMHDVEITFSRMPERLLKVMEFAVFTKVPGCYQVSKAGVRFSLRSMQFPVV